MTQDWVFADAQTLLQALQAGEVSSRELLESFVRQIEQHNKQINAVIATDLPAARRRADEADAARAENRLWGPLHGLPMTIKDTYEVPGMPCTAGAPIYRSHMPAQPAVAVQKLIEAGAIIFGKTNVPLFASDLQSFNAIYGTTHNPWDPARTPGGSSGGAAAALAAGFTPLELGSDIGGSIRTPAHFCGVYGHKATHGIISLQGHVPGPPGTLGEPDLAVAGPMARCAADLSLLLEVIGGASPRMQGWQLQLPPPRAERLAAYRVLLWADDPFCPVDASVTRLFSELEQKLKAHGVNVTLGPPPGFSLAQFCPLYFTLLGSVMGASQSRMVRTGLGLAAPLLKRIGPRFDFPDSFSHFVAGMAMSHADWLRASEMRNRLGQKFQQVFDQFDVILMPVAPTTALPHQQAVQMPLRKISVNNRQRSYADMFSWIAPATLLGLPATSAPLGITSNGLPANVQILGAAFQDKTTIKFAELLGQVMGGFRRPPRC